ncbi:MAG TPA: Flp family type IVb pilin [Pseudolabrys sp.]|nr:Flp family type IVb pilin [Pseudolabrys sp.]
MIDFAPAACMRKLLHDQSGATAIEYAMIASGIAFVIAATVFTLGTSVNQMFSAVQPAFN